MQNDFMKQIQIVECKICKVSVLVKENTSFIYWEMIRSKLRSPEIKQEFTTY